jgi:hypothetical protein
MCSEPVMGIYSMKLEFSTLFFLADLLETLDRREDLSCSSQGLECKQI